MSDQEIYLDYAATAPLDPAEADRLFREGVALFNGARYWHAHEKWETLWRAAPDDERDFYQGLIKLAAGFLHLSRRNRRGARNKLVKGLSTSSGTGDRRIERRRQGDPGRFNGGASCLIAQHSLRGVTVNR
jgi:hypothetical protein